MVFRRVCVPSILCILFNESEQNEDNDDTPAPAPSRATS